MDPIGVNSVSVVNHTRRAGQYLRECHSRDDPDNYDKEVELVHLIRQYGRRLMDWGLSCAEGLTASARPLSSTPERYHDRLERRPRWQLRNALLGGG